MYYTKGEDDRYLDLTVNEEQKQKITQYALDYVISLTVEWLESNKKADNKPFSITDEKRLPELNASKLLFYPFYFATANGSSMALFDVLGEFKMIDYGPISMTLYSLIEEQEDDTKENPLSFKIDFAGLKLKENSEWNLIKETIKKKIIIDGKGVEINFGDICICKDGNPDKKLPIFKAIDASYAALYIQSNNHFLDYDLTRFQEIAKKYYTVNEKIKTEENYDGTINYKDIIDDRRFVPIS